ncbi:MAG: efflux RND transporter periplasmic adaptor subunit [Deltaproteobacteria bacterium]|nr:efflux RND transporter periplasmic adaptor subunit [Deltaproteobacteria bacterium]
MSDQLSSDLASLRIRRDEGPGGSFGRRAMVSVVILCALGIAGAIGYQKLSPRLYKQVVTLTEVALISPAQSSVVVTSTGYVVPQVLSRVGAKVPGRVSRVLVKEGDVVKAGDVIALLEGADQRSAIAAAQSRVLVARAAVQTARANLAEVGVRVERARSLVGQKAMPAMELQDVEEREKVLTQSVKVSEAQVAAAEAEASTWRVGLKDRVIVAPISGTVISKPAVVGETVGPQLTGVANVAEIADFASIVVEVDVPEARLGLIAIGGPAEIVLDAYPSRRYRGITLNLGKRVNRAKATVVVKVKFKDSLDGVLPDMSARVSFLREELKEEALKQASKKVVAADAVVDRDGAKVVFVFEEGKLRMTKVATGAAVGGSIELLDGPSVGARVVRTPSSDNFDGQRVKNQGAE